MLIDLRSDTVTRPTPEMLKYMFSARVGDDVYKEDPSINELQEKTAKIFGKEAGLFCPSGTMTNQCAIKAHTQPGDEVICDVSAHIFNYEGGGMAFNSGVQAKLVNGDRGRFTAKQVEEVLHPQADWLPRTSLVCIENTSNRGGGSYYRLQDVKEIAEVSHKNNLALHLDGARIFNALTETGESPLEYGKLCDSISVCFSKGLGAPVGSVILGSHEFIGKARRVRKLFGGGMRQGGYLAAAAIYALDNHIGRLKEDHKRAKILGDVLKTNSMILDMLPVETNIIIFTLSDGITAEKFVQLLGRQNILVSATGKQTVRMVTHLDFTDPMLEIVEKAIKNI
ncbi:MAG: aminotransferase class I/II-fold pyridoxal phosphate-dependent enzyme [Bacteroidia bacterium]|nr:aminotransferase class I/II-fold pyridoxal phosphate-dependent enzyme [Bacteroidia bacterium]